MRLNLCKYVQKISGALTKMLSIFGIRIRSMIPAVHGIIELLATLSLAERTPIEQLKSSDSRLIP